MPVLPSFFSVKIEHKKTRFRNENGPIGNTFELTKKNNIFGVQVVNKICLKVSFFIVVSLNKYPINFGIFAHVTNVVLHIVTICFGGFAKLLKQFGTQLVESLFLFPKI